MNVICVISTTQFIRYDLFKDDEIKSYIGLRKVEQTI